MRKRGRRLCKSAALLAFITALAFASCDRPSKTPPPESAVRVMEGIKAAYNAENKQRFCADFADIMFTKGFTEDAYLDVIRELKHKYGDWNSETYLGLDERAHEWRVQMEKGKLKLILILNEESKVTGLWFRWSTFWEGLSGD